MDRTGGDFMVLNVTLPRKIVIAINSNYQVFRNALQVVNIYKVSPIRNPLLITGKFKILYVYIIT